MAETKTGNYGLQVMGNIRVFRKDKEIQGSKNKTFTVTDVWFNVSEQEKNGDWFNRSMNLLFKKGVPVPENNQVITILNSFPVITGNDDYRKIALMVCDWEVAQ